MPRTRIRESREEKGIERELEHELNTGLNTVYVIVFDSFDL